ncbi:hypothetical protein EC9_30660 [Rosistilla ulvae]|uniref:DUF2062 domain-containing protein n=1 Tax=Rosistilla ulvae TaxID=1930277 RepID=A0A517M1W7_9BACT|nr:TIGR03546 family protein [Rosistilla ulvae]QDS88871.1 hypothetical protein EC9_30660 [Rosistilla ulvae]
MIIWLYRQIQGVRKALAGRDKPEELAWAMALGVLLGVVPKGNLAALMLVFVVLILRVNHAMAAVTAVAVSFAAVLFDPFTHQLGQWVLEQPALQGFYAWSWQQPLIPWTDLNNTVVMGSLLFGLMTLFPTYSLTLPLFRAIAKEKPGTAEDADVRQTTSVSDVETNVAPEPVAATSAPQRSPQPQVDVIRVHREHQTAAKPIASSGPKATCGGTPQVKKQEKAA